MSVRVLRALACTALACIVVACEDDPAQREYLKAVEMARTGQPREAQLRHLNLAVQLAPDNAHYLETRGGLLLSLGLVQAARADYDRAVELADRPYLRFERADALCALADYRAALADLDHAIAAQPWNVQFYQRRALIQLALGRVPDARTDVDRAFAAPRPGIEDRYARAAVLLMEGRFEQALIDLDYVIANSSEPSHGALPRTLRVLAHVALGQLDRVATDFEPTFLRAAGREPDMGPHYWLAPRRCANGFIAAQAGHLVSSAQPVLDALQPSSRAPVAAPPASAAAATAEPSRQGLDDEARRRLASLARGLRLAGSSDFDSTVPSDRRLTALSADLDGDGGADLAVIAVGAQPPRHEYWLLLSDGSAECVLSRPGARVEKPMEMKPAGELGLAARRYSNIVPGYGDEVDVIRDGRQDELERRRAEYRRVPALVVCTSGYDLCGTSTTWYYQAGRLRSFTAGD